MVENGVSTTMRIERAAAASVVCSAHPVIVHHAPEWRKTRSCRETRWRKFRRLVKLLLYATAARMGRRGDEGMWACAGVRLDRYREFGNL